VLAIPLERATQAIGELDLRAPPGQITEPGRVDELTIDELDSVNGGRINLPMNDFVKALKIAQLERDCPGFV